MAASPHKTLPTLATADGFKYFPPDRELAFFGFLQTHVELTRGLDQALSSGHAISLTGYEVLNRLGRAPKRSLRMTDLAEQALLSLSRVSRLVDELAGRNLVERRACTQDKRVSYVALTDDGCSLLREAQETFLHTVEESFLGRLTEEETRVLADVFGRISGGHERRTALS
jgi:DNA-binding MarR family transcriptional regulator